MANLKLKVFRRGMQAEGTEQFVSRERQAFLEAIGVGGNDMDMPCAETGRVEVNDEISTVEQCRCIGTMTKTTCWADWEEIAKDQKEE